MILWKQENLLKIIDELEGMRKQFKRNSEK